MPGLPSQMLSIAVKPIITVMNALSGAITPHAKSCYLSTVLSSPCSSIMEYMPPRGWGGLTHAVNLLSTGIRTTHSVSMRCQYGGNIRLDGVARQVNCLASQVV